LRLDGLRDVFDELSDKEGYAEAEELLPLCVVHSECILAGENDLLEGRFDVLVLSNDLKSLLDEFLVVSLGEHELIEVQSHLQSIDNIIIAPRARVVL
jgi:hypothetical protein